MDQPATAAKPTDPKAPKEKPIRKGKFETLYPAASILKLLVKKNPKKEGSKSRERFEHYNGSRTVGDYLKKGGTYQDLVYDIGRLFVAVTTVAPAVK